VGADDGACPGRGFHERRHQQPNSGMRYPWKTMEEYAARKSNSIPRPLNECSNIGRDTCGTYYSRLISGTKFGVRGGLYEARKSGGAILPPICESRGRWQLGARAPAWAREPVEKKNLREGEPVLFGRHCDKVNPPPAKTVRRRGVLLC